jgi:hypothetical protein
MTVKTASGRTLHVHFVHSSYNGITRVNAGAERQALDADARLIDRRLTLCDVSEVEGADMYTLLGQGVAVCHPNDSFNKATGRKKAMTAALRASGLSDMDRRDVWNDYLKPPVVVVPKSLQSVSA